MDINEAMKRETSMAGYEGEPPTGDENVEVVQRSGLFGKVLLVERESVESVHMSMRSCASYRSNISKISSAKRGEDEGLDANIAPPQHAPWQNIAAIMVSEVVGAGVLTLSQKYAELGWIIPSIAIIAIFFLVVYTSSMMVEVRKVFPGIVCLSDGADYTYGKWARIAVQTFVILYLVCTLGDYLLLGKPTPGGVSGASPFAKFHPLTVLFSFFSSPRVGGACSGQVPGQHGIKRPPVLPDLVSDRGCGFGPHCAAQVSQRHHLLVCDEHGEHHRGHCPGHRGVGHQRQSC